MSYSQPVQPNFWNSSQGQPSVYVPQTIAQSGTTSTQHRAGPDPNGSFLPAVDPFVAGVASNMLAQHGQSYLQRSQAYVQSKMGFLSAGMMSYLFAVTPDYVRQKLFILLFPYVRKWSFAREPDQLSGTNRYLPPRQDVNAPDLYIPFMGLWTYCILQAVISFGGLSFKPDILYSSFSSAVAGWILHTFVLKALLWAVGVPSAAPILELMAYAGYPFVMMCLIMVSDIALGDFGHHIAWAYCSICAAVFLVRTMKRVLLQEAGSYG